MAPGVEEIDVMGGVVGHEQASGRVGGHTDDTAKALGRQDKVRGQAERILSPDLFSRASPSNRQSARMPLIQDLPGIFMGSEVFRGRMVQDALPAWRCCRRVCTRWTKARTKKATTKPRYSVARARMAVSTVKPPAAKQRA